MNNNDATIGVYTDYGIATILNNFSEDMIRDIIQESIDKYRFRPFGLRAPNYPEIFNQKFNTIIIHSTGYDEDIQEQRVMCLNTIISTILDYYHLVLTSDIPDEELYTVCYTIYQLFVSEFTERMVNFFTQFILNNMNTLLNNIKINNNISISKNNKNSYGKQIYNNQELELVYENMNYIIDVLASLDVPLDLLITYLSDDKTSNLICNYVIDTGDVYKNYFASFLTDQSTSADMITKIRLKYVEATIENKEILKSTFEN